jgi:cytochrome c553
VKRALLLLVPLMAGAQDIVKRGAQVFAQSCATSYCHGPKGAGGGAPKLAARGFDEAYITSVTRAGVPGTAMQGYGTVLARPDFNAVVAYLASLNGIEPRNTNESGRPLPPQAQRGRDLFIDSTRGVNRCSTCHQGDGFGIAVAPINTIPPNAAALRNIATPDVRQATVDGDRFPALIVSQGGRKVVLYDLTTPPPVLRTADAGSVKIGESAGWKHAPAMASYSDSDLDAILLFLRSAR